MSSDTFSGGESFESEVLLAALHSDPDRLGTCGVDQLSQEQWARLIALARDQRVRPLLHQGLLDSGAWRHSPASVWRQLTTECQQIAISKITMHAELRATIEEFARDGIDVIVLKGAHLGPEIYRNVALREMNDIDVLVRTTHLRRAVELATGRGFAATGPFSIDFDTRMSQHVTRLIKPGRAGLEIHWNITPPGLRNSIDPAALWNDARPLDHVGTPCLGLSPENLILHLCFHAATLHQFEFGLRPSCDVSRTIRHYGTVLNWSRLADVARQRRWTRAVTLALRIAQDLVGAEIPAGWLNEVAPRDLAAGAPLAKQLIWTTPDEFKAFSRGLATVASAETFSHRAQVIQARLFPRSPTVGGEPSGPRNGLGLPLVVNIFGVLRRSAVSAARYIWRRNGAMQELARKRSRMREWLSRDDLHEHGQ